MQTPIVALIYDFDKTLSPRDMEEYSFLPGIRVEPDAFWGECARFARANDMDGILTYMYLMQKEARGRLELTREAMQKLGEAVIKEQLEEIPSPAVRAKAAEYLKELHDGMRDFRF